MPYRTTPFVNEHFYHVYNRGVEKRSIFEKSWDYNRLIKTIRYYQFEGPKPKLSKFLAGHLLKPVDESKKIVDIISYCLMPNHFHFLVRQLRDGGITEFVSKLSNSYTKYYNTKHTRVGSLFQGQFKAVLIESDEQLLHVSRYIHLNPLVSNLTRDLNLYRWSSYSEYIDNNPGICNKEPIMSFFKSSGDYEKFIADHADYGLALEIIKHQLLEDV